MMCTANPFGNAVDRLSVFEGFLCGRGRESGIGGDICSQGEYRYEKGMRQ
jgi:hypothetical protein